jgi:AbrB family looped-hinge helix DNA binding protein
MKSRKGKNNMENKHDGKLMSVIKVGEKGQIAIPKDMRDMFNIKAGETVLLLADKDRGIAIVSNEEYMKFAQSIFEAQKNPFGGNDDSN